MKKIALLVLVGASVLAACNNNAKDAEAKQKAMEDSIKADEEAQARQKAVEDSIARAEAEAAAMDTVSQDTVLETMAE